MGEKGNGSRGRNANILTKGIAGTMLAVLTAYNLNSYFNQNQGGYEGELVHYAGKHLQEYDGKPQEAFKLARNALAIARSKLDNPKINKLESDLIEIQKTLPEDSPSSVYGPVLRDFGTRMTRDIKINSGAQLFAAIFTGLGSLLMYVFGAKYILDGKK